MTRHGVISGGLAATAVILSAVACAGGPAPLDRAETEVAVAAAVARQSDLEVDEVTCAQGSLAEVGDELSCTVGLGDVGELGVVVTLADQDGTVEVAQTDAIVDPAVVTTELKAALADRFERSFQVDCGDGGVTVRSPGDTFTCRARDATSRRSVQVTVEDPSGTLSFALDDPPAGS